MVSPVARQRTTTAAWRGGGLGDGGQPREMGSGKAFTVADERRPVCPRFPKVRLNRDVKRVLLVPGEQELPVRRSGGTAEVVVPKLEMHSLLVVE